MKRTQLETEIHELQILIDEAIAADDRIEVAELSLDQNDLCLELNQLEMVA